MNNIDKISSKLKVPFIEWNGIGTLMLGGWRLLPIHIVDFDNTFEKYSDKNLDEVIKLIREDIKRYKFKSIKAWSILSNDMIAVKKE